MTLTLHSFWAASAPYRVRIGLALKGISFDYAAVNLFEGAHRAERYRALNPLGLVPTLETPDGLLTQSLAILEWLEETHPEPSFLPKGAYARGVVRGMAAIVACEIHPPNTPRMVGQLSEFGLSGEQRKAWTSRWLTEGFAALEPLVARHGAGFAFGETPGLADCFIVPQVYRAVQGFKFDISPYPAIQAVAARCARHPAFVAAHPDNQPDAPSQNQN